MSDTKNHALITGGSGYFGSLLLQKLLNKGDTCGVFDLNDADDRPSEVKFFRGDIRDYESIANACEGVNVVYHNVAQVPLAKDRKLFLSVNVSGTENMLRAARAAGVNKVVYTSSSAVFGVPRRNPVSEDTEPSPAEAYGKAKYEGEKVCQLYAEKGLDVTVVRPRTIMGHGRLGIMQILFEWILKGKKIPIFGAGENIYQFVHADDMADACIRAAARKGPAVYNIGADNYCTMRETLEGLIAHANTGSRVISVPMATTAAIMKLTSSLRLSPLGPYHWLMYGRSMYFDSARAKSELNWSPTYGNVEMFCQSYDWYQANRKKVMQGLSGASHHRSSVKQGILKVASWFL